MDDFADATTLLACAVAALMLAQSWVTPARARLLWLLSGASRTGIFRLAERTLAEASATAWLNVP